MHKATHKKALTSVLPLSIRFLYAKVKRLDFLQDNMQFIKKKPIFGHTKIRFINRMKIIKLYTEVDGKSYFKEIDSGIETQQLLGSYSRKYPASGILFREFDAGLEFLWHTAPQNQYIIYIEGTVEVEASGGEKRIFSSGDILLASDLTGAGHITRTLSSGKSIIVEAGLKKEVEAA